MLGHNREFEATGNFKNMTPSLQKLPFTFLTIHNEAMGPRIASLSELRLSSLGMGSLRLRIAPESNIKAS